MTRAVTLLGLACAACSLMSCGKAGKPAAVPPNVLVLTLDTTRRDHMGFHGFGPFVTPNLDRLAAKAVIFEDAYTVAPVTLPSHASLMTGLYPVSHGVRDNSVYRLPESARTLAETLADEGYDTGAAVAAIVLAEDSGMAQGFAAYDSPRASPGSTDLFMAERSASRTVQRARQMIDAQQEPFFFWLHLFDPHYPYGDVAVRAAAGEERTPERERELYAEEIRTADAEIGLLLEHLKKTGKAENLVILFAADHGESLFEGPEITHGHYIFDATMRIPLFLVHPDLTPGRFRSLVSLVDMVPTLLSLLGVDVKAQAFDGLDLSSALRSGAELPADRAVALECYAVYVSHGWAPYEGLVQGDWKLIRSKTSQLYQRHKDPQEREDLHAAEPARAASLRQSLEGFFADPALRLEPDARGAQADDAQWLAALGYVEAPKEDHERRPDLAKLTDPREKAAFLEAQDQLNLRLMRQDYAGAVQILEDMARQERDSAVVHQGLGSLLLTHFPARLDEAERYLRRALEIRHSQPTAHFNLGLCALQRANTATEPEAVGVHLREAGLSFNQTLEYAPTHRQALANLAYVQQQLADQAARTGDLDLARSLYRQAVQHLEEFLNLVVAGEPDHRRVAAFLQSCRQSLAALERS